LIRDRPLTKNLAESRSTDIALRAYSDIDFTKTSVLMLSSAKRQSMKISIIPYRNEHHAAFRELNLEWLDHYQLTESHDLMILDKPEDTVINPGGFIWMAEANGEIVGSVGLMKEREGEFELIKMAVTADYRGKGISKMLIEVCIDKARGIGAKKLSLFSNHQLQRAIGLYEKYGFHHVELVDSPMVTADIRMELIL
jgi:N-acetylglutamate synthase-like GNAT family acetyltransferase